VLTTDDVLAERYRLDEPLARGGMGEVWRATDLVLQRTVAVKALLPAFDEDADFGRRFQAEAQIMAALHHPGLVEVYDYGEARLESGRDVTYLVMQYVDGEPLSHRLAGSEPLTVEETLRILTQAADALHAAHRHGIIHRDVKPGNLMIEADGTVRLVDFGIARAVSTTTAATAHRVVGTALYIAPEQALGRSVTPATDVYALGAVGYHCLTGRPPFPGDSPVEVALRHVQDEPAPLPDDIPEPVRALIYKALRKDPADRYPTAARSAAAATVAGGGAAASTGAATAEFSTPTLVDVPAVRAAPPPPSDVDGPSRLEALRRPRTAAAAALLAALGATAIWFGLIDADPATPAERPVPATTRTVTTPANRTGGPARTDRSTSPTTVTTTPGTAEPTTAPPVTTPPPEPTAEPTTEPAAPPTSQPPPALTSAPPPA